jgi:hypothetical protein
MTVILTTSGAHQSYPGYGSRDYSKYIRERDVRFPFDVYVSGTYYPKNTWVQLAAGQQSLNLYLPVWIDEGNYDVVFRSIAINAPSDTAPAQTSANLNLSNYVATRTMPVQIIGRLFDFRITDIGDYNWERVFRTQKGSADPTGNVYWVGDKDLDGKTRGNSAPFMLRRLHRGQLQHRDIAQPGRITSPTFAVHQCAAYKSVGEGRLQTELHRSRRPCLPTGERRRDIFQFRLLLYFFN